MAHNNSQKISFKYCFSIERAFDSVPTRGGAPLTQQMLLDVERGDHGGVEIVSHGAYQKRGKHIFCAHRRRVHQNNSGIGNAGIGADYRLNS